MDMKFKLTDETKINFVGKKLFRIEATTSWRNIKKGDKGGWIEKESNLSGNAWVSGDAEVSGDARVYGDAWVYGDARVSLKKDYTKGHFVHSSDGDITPTIVDQSKEDGFDGSRDYKNLLVIGDYEITDREPQEKKNPTEIQIDGATYVLKESK